MLNGSMSNGSGLDVSELKGCGLVGHLPEESQAFAGEVVLLAASGRQMEAAVAMASLWAVNDSMHSGPS